MHKDRSLSAAHEREARRKRASFARAWKKLMVTKIDVICRKSVVRHARGTVPLVLAAMT